MRPRFLGFALSSDAKVKRAAREFAEMVGAVVNSTISHAPITFVEVNATTWYIAHVGGDKLPAAMPLVNGKCLYLYNLLGVRRAERFFTTLEYRYVYQATEDDSSWIFRYEYDREPPDPYPYAREHLHVNASPASYTGAEPFPGLHLPTGRRITIERLVRHLIAEHELTPISDDWETTVKEAEGHFRDVQQKRLANPDPDG
jgi:hypothetical protein